jgi:hypothetical protein
VILIVAVISGLSVFGIQFPIVSGIGPSGFPVHPAVGFGHTCFNRHDASFQSVIVKADSTNYTGSGVNELASVSNGYVINIILTVNPDIMYGSLLLDPQTNASIFFASDIFGVWYPHCYANLNMTNLALSADQLVIPYHPLNSSGYAPGTTQTVTLSTGTHVGQYNVTWTGP